MCPSCGAPLTGAPACAACGIRLTGIDAQQLWQVDLQLASVEERRRALLETREQLLESLRGDAVDEATALVGAVTSVAVSIPDDDVTPLLPAGDWPGPPQHFRAQPKEWTPARVQNTLLGLGGLLLAIAAIVFTAVAYDRLGNSGRALVLLAAVAITAAVPAYALRRNLRATAETVTVVALVLAILDGIRAP